VRGDRSARGHVERSTCTRRNVGSGKHPGPQRAVLLRGRAVIRGSRSVAARGREGSPGLALSAPVTNGCTRGAEEGLSRNIKGARNLHSVPRPTVLGPPVGGVARRRRGGWFGFHIGFAKPSREKADSGWLNQGTWFAVRRPRPSRRGESPRSQNAKRVAALVALRRSRLVSVLVRRSFTGCRSR
jgi:hypothetical protein